MMPGNGLTTPQLDLPQPLQFHKAQHIINTIQYHMLQPE
jgi:hypothetical protein